jgi:beta-lactam-binding protein with PASTA domain
MSKFGSYLKTKAFRYNLLGAIGSVIGVVLIAFFSLGFYTRHGEGIPVPSVKGMQIDRAMELLKNQGFGYQIDSVYVPDQAPGNVVEQDPDAGTNVKVNRIIYLTMVTRLAPPVSLPDLSDQNYIEAVATLQNYGLEVGDTTTRSDIANHVLEVHFAGQIIKPGSKLPKGSKVDLVLGNGAGASEVELPDFVGQDLDGARFAIKGANLTVGNVDYQGAITDSTNLVVVAQNPVAVKDSVTKVSLGTRINLTVSQGKSPNGSN